MAGRKYEYVINTEWRGDDAYVKDEHRFYAEDNKDAVEKATDLCCLDNNWVSWDTTISLDGRIYALDAAYRMYNK